tara:strand:- start:9325 stop:9573 length:249 start_codon:yes stop_codon:yes gene_type:complete
MMSLRSKDFTIEKGIKIQQEEIRKYGYKVRPEVLSLIIDECVKQNLNPEIKTGYDVFRGNSISTFFQNISEADVIGKINNRR